ncbi:MAG: response regulator transcription factor [Oscillospiraceae bacterium]|nr:response regulator transcription factor [Oscillospiraceae bacterium]
MKNKILVIDDDVMILKMLGRNLLAYDYDVMTARTSQNALDKLKNKPDLILLDVNMPGMNGFELCSLIRDHVSCPIIFLTARVSEHDKVTGLMAGGDDYITKPFSVDELMARIMAHLRRERRHACSENVRFSNQLIIDYSSRTVYFNDNKLSFSRTEFEIIRFLSENAGMVFDRETIYERLWGFDKEGDSVVIKEHIRKIRNKLAEYTDEQYIETVWGVGYKWTK